MKKLLFMMLLTAFLAACTEKKENKKLFLRPPSITLSSQDTIEIRQKVESHISLLKEKKLDELADILYYVDNDTINLLDEQRKNDFVKGLSIFNIYDAKIKHMILRSEYNNEVCVLMQVLKDGNIEENKGVTKFYFNPVKIDGIWYITIRDMHAKGVNKAY